MSTNSYEFEGKQYKISELCKVAEKLFGNSISPAILSVRISRGWSTERAMKTPVKRHFKGGAPDDIRKARFRQAVSKYAKKHPQKIRSGRYLSYARTFLRKYAILEDLQYYQSTIQDVLFDVPVDIVINHHPQIDDLPKDQRTKYYNLASRVNSYLRDDANRTDKGLQELLDIINHRLAD